MTEDYEDWMFCFHSSGTEPGCVGCWYGSYQRANKENQELRRGIEAVGFEVLNGEFVRRDGTLSSIMVVPKDPKKIVNELTLAIYKEKE